MSLSADAAWIDACRRILKYGEVSSPRGKPTIDLPHDMVVMNARRPVIINPERRLSYQFMAAEAYWILSGDDEVSRIAPWNSHIAQFSDDGVKFFGAYGPKIRAQLPFVLAKLREDRDSRQAFINIWRESPGRSKDIPCTISVGFRVRERFLDSHVFMRSSDVWLGLPYDLFNQAMLNHLVCAALRDEKFQLEPGKVYVTRASAHAYRENLDRIHECLRDAEYQCPQTPEEWYKSEDALMSDLLSLRDSVAGDHSRWWEWKVTS